MTEERDTEQAGAAIDETGATETEVMAAVERAIDPADASSASSGATGEVSAEVVAADASAGAVTAEAGSSAAEAALVDTASVDPIVDGAAAPLVADMDMPSAAPVQEAPAAEAASAPASTAAAEQIQVPADHPMAGFYVQTPLPPEVRGNRGAGVLIALVATVGFALVYAGVCAALIARSFPPSTFLSEGLLPILMSWGFIIPVAAFFVGLSALVLIVGRAGWWAYVFGGFFVAILVWVASIVGFALPTDSVFNFASLVTGGTADASVWQPRALLEQIGLSIPALAAAIVAREVTVWFGAWIGARGRKMKAKNAEALAEYQARVEETKAV